MFLFSNKILIVFVLSLLFCAPTFASTISRPMSNAGLMGYWDFESGKGDATAYDKSGRGNNGILTSMNNNSSWTSSSSTGQALNFDGSDDWINVNDAPSVDIYPSITMVAWFKTNTVSGARSIITKGSSGQAFNYGFGLNGTSIFSRHHSGDNISSAVVVTTGVWHQLAIVNNGSRDYFYYDGVLVDSIAYTSNSTNDLPLTIGATCVGASCTSRADKFNGLLDEVRIYNRALSADEISRLYKIQKPKISSGINNTGLVGYWPLDEGSGTRAEDVSFNTNKGTINGGTWVAGKNGKALSFNGSSDYVLVSDNSNVQQANVRSISVWIKPNSLSETVPRILNEYEGGSTGWSLVLRGSGDTFPNSIDMSFNGNYSRATPSGGINSTSSWLHIVVVMSSTATINNIYLNGVDQTLQDTASNAIINGSTVGFSIGARTDPARYFNGSIDDVRIYNRALSAAEVKALYEGSVASVVNKSKTNRITDGLVGYWTFDGNKIAGVTAYDSSTNGNNGTMSGGPTPTIGKIGQALSFDGSDDYISLGSSVNLGTTHSISLWVKSDATAGNRSFLRGAAAGNFLRYTTSQYQYRENGSTATKAGTLTTSIWKHVVVIREEMTVTFYEDGVSLGTSSLTTNNNQSVDYLNAPENFFDGSLDDVRIYNRALSSDEVKALYQMGR